MKRLFLLLVVLFQCAFAQNFDFNSKGEEFANETLKNFIQNQFYIDDVDTVAYKYDDMIIGIAKYNIFHTLGGYKLITLKQQYDGYKPIKNDIVFDNTLNFYIDSKKIKYQKTVFYRNKKYCAKIKNDEIVTRKSIFDRFTDRKVQNIEQLTTHTKNTNVNNLELSDFKTNPERSVNIKYNNLNEKTRHYIEMR